MEEFKTYELCDGRVFYFVYRNNMRKLLDIDIDRNIFNFKYTCEGPYDLIYCLEKYRVYDTIRDQYGDHKLEEYYIYNFNPIEYGLHEGQDLFVCELTGEDLAQYYRCCSVGFYSCVEFVKKHFIENRPLPIDKYYSFDFYIPYYKVINRTKRALVC